MGLFNLFSSGKSFDTNEFHTKRHTLEMELRPYLNCNHLSDEAAELYYKYTDFLTSIITGVIIKIAYQDGKNVSDEDNYTKSIFKTAFEECINFQERYILRGSIEKDEPFSSVSFKRLDDRKELFAFLLIKEGQYSKEIKQGIKSGTPFELIEEEFTDELITIDGESPSFTSTIKKYPSFLKDIFCVKIQETPRGIKILDEDDYKIDWDGPETFFTNVILEYKALYHSYKTQ